MRRWCYLVGLTLAVGLFGHAPIAWADVVAHFTAGEFFAIFLGLLGLASLAIGLFVLAIGEILVGQYLLIAGAVMIFPLGIMILENNLGPKPQDFPPPPVSESVGRPLSVS